MSQVLLKGEREVKRHVVRKILGVRKVKSPQQKMTRKVFFNGNLQRKLVKTETLI